MPKSSVINWNEASKLTLYGYDYNIYTQSYLCYGQNEMLKRLAKELIAVRGELGVMALCSHYANHRLVNALIKNRLSSREPSAGTEGRDRLFRAWDVEKGSKKAAQERSSGCVQLPARGVEKAGPGSA